MKKYFYSLLAIVIVSLCYLILVPANIVFNDEYVVLKPYKEQDSKYRLVLITKDVDTAFGRKVGAGALRKELA